MIALSLVGGILYRIRGGVFPIGNTLPRALFAVGTGAATYVATQDPLLSGAVIPVTFGMEVIGNEGCESMDTMERKLIAFALAFARCTLISLPFTVLGYLQPASLLLIAGVLTGLTFILANKFFPDIKLIKIKNAYFIDGYWSVGEFALGLFSWAAILVRL